MTEFHQVVYTWLTTTAKPHFGPEQATLSIRDVATWRHRIERWLRTAPGGTPPISHFYSVYGEKAVLIRRSQPDGRHNAEARLLIGPAAILTPQLALELHGWGWWRERRGRLTPCPLEALLRYRADFRADMRSPAVLEQLVPLLSWVLADECDLRLPPSDQAHAVLWGLQTLLSGPLADRRWKLSFETYDDRPVPPTGCPGLFVRFRKGAPAPVAHSRYGAVAQRLVTDHLTRPDSRATHIPVPPPAPRPSAPGAPRPSGARMSSPASAFPPPPAPSADGEPVTCPFCLAPLNWSGLDLFRYDPIDGTYKELDIPQEASDAQRSVLLRTAHVRCPGSGAEGSSHYLPLGYGQYGPPAVYGLVGATRSGKTHLITAMIGQLEKYGLGNGLTHRPVAPAMHKAILDEQVGPFLNRSQVLEQTRLGAIGLVDAFLVQEGGRPGRTIALFDVAGGDLLEIEAARRFLDVADGLIFVVNAAELGRDGLGDRTFGTVLDLLQASGRLSRISAAIVLNKADLLRFDDPVAVWLRHEDRALDSEASLRESADVYAYLHARGAQAWTRPYRECRRATLHVASAAGSNAVADQTFVRGVRPRRVLNPLLSLMAMTGVLASPEAEKIGI